MKIKPILQTKRVLLGLGAVAILSAASCTNDKTVYYPSRGVNSITGQDYVYYPTHNAYYNRSADNFRVYEGNRWVTLNTLPNVDRQVVLSSEFMPIDEYGTPERHYTEYVQPNLKSGSRSIQRVTTTSPQGVRTISTRQTSTPSM